MVRRIETVKDSVYGLIHDTNNSICILEAVINNIQSTIDSGQKDQEELEQYIHEKLKAVDIRLKKLETAIDNHYKELKESKLWLEPL